MKETTADRIDIAARLAELDRERERLLTLQREELLSERRTRPISIRRLAEEVGVSARPLIDAARAGRLRAWRVGGRKRGELVTTFEAFEAYLATQPVEPVEEGPKRPTKPDTSTIFARAVDRARRRSPRAVSA